MRLCEIYLCWRIIQKYKLASAMSLYDIYSCEGLIQESIPEPSVSVCHICTSLLHFSIFLTFLSNFSPVVYFSLFFTLYFSPPSFFTLLNNFHTLPCFFLFKTPLQLFISLLFLFFSSYFSFFVV